MNDLLDYFSTDEYKSYLSDWCNENLLVKQEAMKITGQSLRGITQSLEKLPAFYLKDIRKTNQGNGLTRLYLKKDIENYAKTMKKGPKKKS
ncbi:hypothetical protein BCR25_15895 [Enterococcus termitis]|uniref:DNA-binding protein n=1 Tax=Enterococcus termitis TaxID=332950 RepID=A0A1E5H1L1_9ENTE|nr:hypothetical protein BCR25_15895 [Enterococcus termitis]